MTPPLHSEATDRPRPFIDWSRPPVASLHRGSTADTWTLVGGLMTQLHTVHHRLGVVRPTNDVDIVLHIETSRGVPRTTATALEKLGSKTAGRH